MTHRFPVHSDLGFDQVPLTKELERTSETGDRCLPTLFPVLLVQMEASLTTSQQALLSRDFIAVERATREQRHLQRQLGACFAAFRQAPRPSPPEIEAGVTCQRILQLARVQLALLGHAQRSLVACARLLAGPGAAYAPPKQTAAVYPVANRERR